MKAIGRKTFYVVFGQYGCGAYMGVTMYENMTDEECILLRCEDATEYIADDGKFHKISR